MKNNNKKNKSIDNPIDAGKEDLDDFFTGVEWDCDYDNFDDDNSNDNNLSDEPNYNDPVGGY